MGSVTAVLLAAILVICEVNGTYVGVGEYDHNYGTYIGKLKELHHDVTAHLYAVDNITIYVKGFNYDGEAPDAYWFAGNRTPKPSNRGFIIPTLKKYGSLEPLGPSKNKSFRLKFPETKKGQRGFHDTKWISVWCKKFAVDFGHVVYPKDMKVPGPVDAGSLKSKDKSVSASSVMLETTEHIRVKEFSFDGSVDDAIFVLGSGLLQDGHQVSDETGSDDPIKKYRRKTLKLKVPHATNNEPIQYFGVWSPTRGMMAQVDFPQNMRIPPGHLV